MNTSSGSHLPSILVPARCPDATDSVSAYLRCLAIRGWTGLGLRGVSKHHLAVKRAAEISEVSMHLRNDIDLTQGQYMAAQLVSVLEDQQAD